MKRFYNLPRAAGKTTRMMYLSEHYQVPILCHSSATKKLLINKAKQYGIDMPIPLDITDIKSNINIGSSNITKAIIDEPLAILERLIDAEIVAMAYSDEDNYKKIRYFSENGYTDKNIEDE